VSICTRFAPQSFPPACLTLPLLNVRSPFVLQIFLCYHSLLMTLRRDKIMPLVLKGIKSLRSSLCKVSIFILYCVYSGCLLAAETSLVSENHVLA
jgi:hypothetical protein